MAGIQHICMHIDRAAAGEVCIILDFVFEVCACVIRSRGQGRKERVEGIAWLIKRTERVGRGKIHNFGGVTSHSPERV